MKWLNSKCILQFSLTNANTCVTQTPIKMQTITISPAHLSHFIPTLIPQEGNTALIFFLPCNSFAVLELHINGITGYVLL